MFVKVFVSIFICAICTVEMWAGVSVDSVSARHQLREVEVLGVKQMPQSGPLPVTRLRAAEIRRLGIDAVKDLGDIVPNLYTPSYGSRMTSSIYMRGLGSRIDQAVIGLNIDGVPYLNKDAFDFDIPDMASAEVLRGAQSVLNGRNAMAGQINIYTLSPIDYRGLRFMAEYGRGNTAKASVAGYFKLSPRLFTSLSGYYSHSDGFWRNEYNGSRTAAENAGTLRWKTVFKPSGSHSITNTFAASITRQSGYPYASVETGRIAYNDTCFYRRNFISDGLTVAWAGRRVVVTSLTSVQYLDDNMTLDQDFTTDDYFTLTQRRHELTFTEDIFAKGSRGRSSWLGGVFGFYRRTRMWAPVTFFNAGIEQLIEQKRNEMNPEYPISWDKREFLLDSEFTTPTGGFAVYHQSRYTAGDFTFEAGLRWDIEKTSCDYHSRADASFTTWHLLDGGGREVYGHTPVDIDDSGHLSQTFNELLPKVVISYRRPFGEVYASFTKGYKSGGFNTQMFSDVLQQRVMSLMGLSMAYKVKDIVTYRPESSFNYEIGCKTSQLDGRLSGEITAFFIDCRDQQLTVFPPGMVTGRIMTNAGRTRSLGAEITARYATPDNRWALSAAYGYTNAVFRDYDNGKADFRGRRVPYAPAHTLFASVLWRTPLTIGRFHTDVNLTVRGTGDIMWNEENTLSQPFYVLPGFNIMLHNGNVSLKLWVENFTDTRYNTFYFMSMGRAFTQRGNPVTFGATLRMNINND